ncbi:MAG: T9SS type A sorting domain-containing protein [Bacteroidia bacterium]
MKIFTLLGAIVLCSFSVFGQTGGYHCLNFNGGGDDVTIKDKTALNPTKEITIEAWIKPESFARNIYENTIFGKHGWGSGNAGYVLRCGASGQASFNVASSAGSWQEAQSSTGVLTTNTWYHIAGTFDGDTVAVYVNGIQVGTRLYSGVLTPSTGLDAKIGELAYGSGRNFDGDIDEVRVWNKAIDRDTLRAWMCQKVNAQHPNYKSLVASFEMNSGKGTSLSDSSSSSLSAKINGADWANSGAAIGTNSVSSFSSVNSLSITGDSADVMSIRNIKGNYSSVHLYHSTGKTQITSVSGGAAAIDTLQTWGVFFAKPNNVSYNARYNYAGFKGKNSINECTVDLYGRNNLATWQWNPINTKIYKLADSITFTNKGSGELVIGNATVGRTLTTNTGDSSFCSAESITIIGPVGTSFDYKWYKDGTQIANETDPTITVNSAGKYTCEYSRGTGCVYKSVVKNISSVASPKVSLSKPAGVCINVDSISISGGLPGGGIYSGSSIKSGDSLFYPSTLNAGIYQLVYSFTNGNNCTSTDTQSIEIYGLPRVSTRKAFDMCDNEDTVKLTGQWPLGGTFYGNGISNGIFYPDSINRKTGKYNYTYSYTDNNGCTNTSKSSISVLASTPITFNAIDSSCVNDPSFRIKTNPNQGTYTGKGMNGRNFNPSVAGVGAHWIRFSFKNLNGCTTKDSQIAVVMGITKASFSASTTLCANDDTLLMKSGLPLGGVYSGNGITNGIFNPKTSGEGKHIVNYVYTNSDGCNDTANATITVAGLTELSYTTLDAQCLNGQALELENASPTGGNYSGNGVSGGMFNPKSAGSGIHNIGYSYTNTDGCTSDTSFTIEVFEAREIKFSLADVLCSNSDSIDLSSTRPKNGTHSGPGVRNEYLVPANMNTGSNWIKYSQIDANDCENLDSIEVTVTDVPNVSLANVASVCENGDKLTLSGGMPAGGTYFIEGTEATEIDPTTLTAGNQYVVSYIFTVSGSNCSDNALSSFWVNEAPQKPSITENNNVLNSSASTGNQWYNDNGPISNENGQSFTPKANGDYYVVVTNDSLCSNQSDVFSFTNSSINGALAYGIEMYPNPSNGLVFIQNQSNKTVTSITVIDLSGKTVAIKTNTNGVNSIDLNVLNSGAYFVHFTTANQEQFIEKLIINKN